LPASPPPPPRRAGRQLRSIRAGLDRLVAWFPLTWAGLALLAAALIALVPYGIGREDRVLLVVGATGVALVAASVIVAFAGALVIRAQLRAAPPLPELAIEVDRPSPTGFVLRRPLWVPWLDVTWSVQAPPVAVTLEPQGRRIVEIWAPRRRGRPTAVHRRVLVRDAFGLTRIRLDQHVDRAHRFTPALGALARVEVVHGLAGGDQLPHPDGRPEGDLADLRSYGQGDPIRYVLWKVFARTRELVVRTPERALAPTRRTLAYLVTSPADEPAAAAARIATSTGALGEEWVFGADGAGATADDPAGAYALLLASADHPAEAGGDGLAGFLASQASFAAHRALVFAPGRPGPWVDRVNAAGAQARLDVLVCVDGIVPHRAGAAVRALLLTSGEPADPATPSRAELAALLRRLRPGGEVRVLDRRTGRLYGGPHLAALDREVA
jgi:hypothetical protein